MFVKDILYSTYGVDNPWKSKEIQNKCKKRYSYNNLLFDSSLEIAYYIWRIDHKIKIEYLPNKILCYSYNNKEYHYHPDFLLVSSNQLVEIKGLHFFNKIGKMICPYRQNDWSDSEYEYICNIYEAKHQCMLTNNVKILRSDSQEIKDIMQYIDNVYGKGYLMQFKNNRISK